MRLAIVPGSFDPMTLGHLALIRRVAAEFDEVVVAVMINAEKHYLFSMEERVEIARLTVEELSNVRVLADDGYLVDLYARLHASAVCKGWRNETDLAYEKEMDAWNRAHCPGFVTKLYKSEAQYEELSSTEVRMHLKKGKSIRPMIAPKAWAIVESKRPSGSFEAEI